MSERRRDRDDDGFSLPELLVSITLLTIVSAAIITSTVAIQRNLGVANATMEDLAATRIGIERVGALLRGAVAIDGALDLRTSALDVGRPDTVTFYTVTGRAADANPLRVTLSVQGTDLVESVQRPTPDVQTATTPTYGAATRRVIARSLLRTDVFRYWSHYQLGADITTRCGRALTATPLSLVDRRAVDSVSFRLVVQQPTGYDSAEADLQGWARFASASDLGVSASFRSAGCLDSGAFGYDEVYTP